jgi:MFS family permease
MQATFLNEYEKPGRQHYRILFMCWAGWMFDFYDLMLFTFLLMPIGKELHLSDIQLSFILGSSLAATAIGGVIFGFLSDYLGRKLTLQLTIIIYSLGTFLSGFAPNLLMLLIFRVITGLGVGGEWATGQTYIGETFPAKMRGRFGAFMQTGAPLGIALAAIVGGYVEPFIAWRPCFFVSVLPAIIIIFISRKLPESDLWLERKKLDKSQKVEKKTKFADSKLGLLFSIKYRKLFILSLILAIFDMSAYWFTYSWLPGYLHKQRNLSIVESTSWMLVTQLGGLIGYTTFGFVSDKIGRRPAYSIYSVIMALGLVMITLLWDTIAAYPSLILFFMFIVGFGTGMFGGYGPLFSELFPTSIRSTAMGSAFNLARGIQFFTPVIITLVAVKYGLAGGISLAALFALLTGAWIWTFPETRGKKLYVETE